MRILVTDFGVNIASLISRYRLKQAVQIAGNAARSSSLARTTRQDRPHPAHPRWWSCCFTASSCRTSRACRMRWRVSGRSSAARLAVAMDFGQVALEDGTVVRLYGTPGQTRFSFMWEILCRCSLGVILLIDGSTPTATADLARYASLFRRTNPRLALGTQEIVAPIFAMDARKRADVL